MKIFIIGTLAALALAPIATSSHASCGNQVGPRGLINDCPGAPHYSSEIAQPDRMILHTVTGISTAGVLRFLDNAE